MRPQVALRGASRAVIAVHGGAWAIPTALTQASLAGVRAAADAGHAHLQTSALDAVEAAVRSLEENPAFNAGFGASLNASGEVELDAVIVDGASLNSGAVAGIGPVLHPVSVARKLMEGTEHVLLVGAGATAFAREMGVSVLDASALVTAEARAEYEAMAAFGTSVSTLYNTERLHAATAGGTKGDGGHDTVGAVARDVHGNLAAATSTGGITFKRVGRVGDSPLLGAGALADNMRGAISTTGHGESILKYTLASRVLHRLDPLVSAPHGPARAVAAELEGMYARLDGGSGGAICIDRDGAVGVAFTSSRMAWAVRDAMEGEAIYGIDRDRRRGAHPSTATPGIAEIVCDMQGS